jgi:hypothetical protein
VTVDPPEGVIKREGKVLETFPSSPLPVLYLLGSRVIGLYLPTIISLELESYKRHQYPTNIFKYFKEELIN